MRKPMRDVRLLAQAAEKVSRLPPGAYERFQGYGVMGATFRSGHLLAMRRFPASSLGAGYSSVWHRSPDGRWTFWSDQPPLQACPRYFGSAINAAIKTEISVTWEGPVNFEVRVPSAGLVWSIHLQATYATHLLNSMASLIPDSWWRSPPMLRAIASMAGRLLRAGRLGLEGKAPNGQHFIANPTRIWVIDHCTASIAGQTLGELGPLPSQARLGDFWIPQRGLFAIGRAFFEQTDPKRHLLLASASQPG
jgi:hypothetical protein